MFNIYYILSSLQLNKLFFNFFFGFFILKFLRIFLEILNLHSELKNNYSNIFFNF